MQAKESPIEGITKRDILRMIYATQIKTGNVYQNPIEVSSLIYEELRYKIKDHLTNLIHKLDGKVTEMDVLHVLRFVPGMTHRLDHCPYHIIPRLEPTIRSRIQKIGKEYTKMDKEYYKLYKAYNSGDESKQAKMDQIYDKRADLRERQMDLREKYVDPLHQKRDEQRKQIKEESSCFYFSSNAVQDLIDEIGAEKGNLSFTSDAYLLIQYELEFYLRQLLERGIQAAFGDKGKTLRPKDLQFAARCLGRFERTLLYPRFVYPPSDVSYEKAYIAIRTKLGIKEESVHPALVKQMDRFSHLLVDTLLQEAHSYSMIDGQETITKKGLIRAFPGVIGEELSKYALEEIKKDGSQLNLHVHTSFRLSNDVSIALSIVIEYIMAEMISLMDGLHANNGLEVAFEEEELGNIKERLGFEPLIL